MKYLFGGLPVSVNDPQLRSFDVQVYSYGTRATPHPQVMLATCGLADSFLTLPIRNASTTSWHALVRILVLVLDGLYFAICVAPLLRLHTHV